MSASSAGSAATQERLTALVSPVVERAGYDLEDLVLTPMGRRSLLRVVIDRDEGISLDDIAGMSHAVAEVLDDDEGVIGKAPYVLEVTSPGVDRPLTEARHWRRAIGRLVEVTIVTSRSAEGSETAERVLHGRVAGFDGSAVIMSVDGVEQLVPLADLGPGKVQLEFNRPDESIKRERPQRQKAKRSRSAALPPAEETQRPTTHSPPRSRDEH
ncbi:MAG: ribosome maturation factor RimP [Actinomycetota bacterium]|nr:ribosome maturation factor RimP [Actinomycetota bacterium]